MVIILIKDPEKNCIVVVKKKVHMLRPQIKF